ncbi:non-ribosomal peptide synthetase [Microbacterium sp. K27]|uniref:non-ribosomal peptide synthetase n=1 Tax=Microbacterium sp. K27 TaxID=2305445 RepID=UPI00109BE9F5|nr:non-ribosomal peptide synthetase [Microbacterium sp. K27]
MITTSPVSPFDGDDGDVLSAAARSIVDAQLLDPDSDVFVVADRVDIVGDVSTALLAEAIRAAIAETDALRDLIVRDAEGHPRRVQVDAPVRIDVHDVSDRPDPTAAADELFAQELARGRGGLDAESMTGQVVVRTAADHVVWLFRSHHALLDGYSISLVAHRVAERYRVLVGAGGLGPDFGRAASLRAEERAYAESAAAEADRASVRTLLDEAGVADAADVPTVSGISAPGVRRAHAVEVPLPAETADALAAVVAADRRLTWADVNVAAFAAFAGRAAGVRRLVLGVPFAARATTGAARTPSMSVTVLPLPVRVDLADALCTVALRVCRDLGVLRRAQRIRGEALAQERGIPSLLRGPGVNIKPYTPMLDFAGAEGTIATVAAGPVDDIDLTITPTVDGGVHLRLEVNPDVHSAADADAIARRYAGFLSRIAAEPAQPLGRSAALAIGDGGASGSEPLPEGGYPIVDISAALARAVAAAPEAIAIRASDDEVTFAHLHARVRALAAVLVSRGIGSDDVVALAMPRGIDLIVAIFAVLEAGGAVAPIDLAYPEERIAFVLRHADPRLVVTIEGSPAAAHPRALVLDGDGTAGLPAASADTAFPSPAPDALASVIYTSGSTGTPKGVGVSRGSLSFFLAHHAQTLFRPVAARAGRRLRAAHTASFAFDSSWEQLLWLLLGHELLVFDEDDRRDAREIVEAVDRLHIDTLDVTPTFASALVDAGLLETAHTPALLLIGGEAASPELWRRLAAAPLAAYNFYGPTEATVDALGAVVEGLEPRIGRALAGTDALVLDAALHPVPVGVAGELALAGPHLARGYLGMAGLTAARFVADPRGGGGRIYLTGDIVRVEEDGLLSTRGRRDDQVKVRGYRVELGEVRSALASLPHVARAEAIVRGVGASARLFAYAVPADATDPTATGGILDAEDLLSALRSMLPDHLVPHGVVVLPELPQTAHGKLDVAALPDPVRTRSAGVAPANDRERAVCRAIGDVLGLDTVPADADVIVLGGDSISVIAITAKLRQAGWVTRPRELFAARTAQGLAPLLRPLDAPGGAPVRPATAATGPVPLPPVARALRALAPSLEAVRDYAQSVELRVPGADAAGVTAALAGLLSRHPVLSLVVREQPDGTWHAEIPAASAPIPLLEGADAEELHSRLRDALDPTSGRMVAAGLVPADGVLVLVAHHLVVDGVSWRILIDELGRLLDGRPLPAGPESVWRHRAQALEELRLDAAEENHWRGIAARSCAVFPHPVPGPEASTAVRVWRGTDPRVAAAVLDRIPLVLDARPDAILVGALAVALQDWAGVEGTLLVEWETHGREPLDDGEELADGIGWFTTEFPVAVDLPLRGAAEAERLTRAVRAVRQARADVPHDGYGADAVADRAVPGVLLNYLGRFGDTTPVTDQKTSGVALRRERPFTVHHPDRLRLGHAIEVAVFVAPGDRGLEVEWTVAPALAETLPTLLEAWDRALEGFADLADRLSAPEAAPAATLIPAEAALPGLDLRMIERVEAERGALRDIAPLTALQEGLLFHALRDGAEDVYATVTTIPLEDPRGDDAEPLELERIAQAVRTVVRAHPQLGAAFVVDLAERPVQLVPRRADVDVTLHEDDPEEDDREGKGTALAARAEKRVAALVDAELARTSDVSRPPLVHAHVVRSGRSAAVLVLAAHHLVIDGWSTPLLIERVVAAAAGETVADGWADLRRTLVAQEAVDQTPARDAWSAHLAGLDGPTFLAPAAQSDSAGDDDEAVRANGTRTIEVPLDPRAGERLLVAARNAGLTAGVVVVGAWAHVAGRAAGRTDVVVGMTTAGRATAVEGVDRVVGLLSVTVPVRLRMRPEVPFSAHLADLQQQRAGLHDHEALPLSDIESLVGVGTLFDTLVVVENYPSPVAAGEGRLRVGEVQAAGGTHYAVGITVLPGEGLRIALEHDVARLPEERAVALAAEFALVLERLSDDLDATPATLPVMDGEQALVGPEPARTPRDDSGASAVLAAFRAAVASEPDAVALRFRDRALRAADLADIAGGIQAALERAGAGPEHIVALAVPRSVEAVAAIIATLSAGAAYLPIDVSSPRERLREVLAEARPALMIAPRASVAAALAADAGIVVLDPAEIPPAALQPRAVHGSAAAYVIFTSGSTGRPKGVVLTRDALDTHFDGLRSGRHAELVARLTAAEGRDRIVAVHSASFAFDTSLIQLHWLFAGHELILLDDDERRDPALFTDRARGADVIDVAPVLAEQLVEEGLFDGDRPLPEVLLGGEAVSTALWSALRERSAATRTLNLYGPTEATVDALGAIVAESAEPLIGTPVPGASAVVLDAWLRPVAVGTRGELYLQGGQLARGYLGRPGLTASRFVAAPGGARRYRTGDLVRVDGAGRVEYHGRLDDQVKVAGNRIELGEVEAALRSLGGVSQASAALDAEGPVGARLLAVVTVSDGVTITSTRLREELAALLPAAAVPARIAVTDAIPVTVSGKVDRAAVRALALASPGEDPTRRIVAPTTAEEQALVAAVGAVIGGADVSMDDDFFALGGHSLTALRVLGAMRRAGYALSVRDILQERVLHRIAARAKASTTAPADATPAETPETGAIPVSAAQRRLLFLAELEGPTATYTVPVSYDLPTGVRAADLQRAWEALIAHHAVLRTVYRRTDGGFDAEVLAHPPMSFAVIDVDGGLEVSVAREEEHVFDVFAAPPVRAALLRSSEGDVLVIAAHHIAVDETSFRVIREDLSALLAGRAPAATVPFGAFAAAEATSEAVAVERWRERLRDIPVELDLPTDRPRPEKAGYRAETVAVAVAPKTVAALDAFAAAQGATRLMVLQAAVASLFRALGAGTDIVLGTPATTRDARFERTVGYLVNTLPLRIDVAGDATFSALVERARDALLDALDDVGVPFEEIVDACAPRRSLARHPLFQTMVTVEEQAAGALDLPAGPAVERPGLVDAARFDLAIRYRDPEHPRDSGDADGALTIVAAAELFDRATAERLALRLVTWIDRLLADPTAPVCALDARLPDEPARIPEEDERYRVTPVLDALTARALETPSAVAVRGDGETWDYATLLGRAAGIAGALRARGIGPEDRVAVAVGRTPVLLAALIGVLAAGAAYVPLDVDYPDARLRLMLDDADPVLVLVDESTHGAGRGRSELSVHAVAPVSGGVYAAAGVVRGAPAPAESAAYVIYTSGSTGRPKGVVVSRSALDAFLSHERSVLALTAADRLLAVTTVSFDIAALELFVPLISGAAVVIASREEVRDPDRLAALARREACTVLQATPSLWRPLLEEQPEAWGAVTALVGGEAVPADLARGLRSACRAARVVYGPTEATVWAMGAMLDDDAHDASVPIGRPFAGVGAVVLDDALRPVPHGVAGELYLAGPQLARGYRDRPDLTAGRFVADPTGEPGARMYRTGDLVRREASGTLRFLRRIDDQVKVDGHRLELGEIESALRGVEGVHRAAAVVRTDSSGRARLLGYVTPEEGVTLDGAAVRDAVAATAPPASVPRIVTVLDAIPLTLNGKIDRGALPDPVAVVASGRGPENDAERAVVEAVAEILERSRVSPEEAFFELGGDSISSIRLVALVRARGFTITPGQVFAHERLAGLAAAAVPVGVPGPTAPHGARRTRARLAPRDLSSIERLLEETP